MAILRASCGAKIANQIKLFKRIILVISIEIID